MRAGAAAFLQKPVNGDVLLQTIGSCLARPEARVVQNTYSVSAQPSKAETFAFGK
ncbi:hypothetical protein ACPOL_5333 [Acidisarcina polymorpha]|uniref:Response regulatory domain-containing protein n=2 Tax=Acidisarcina polymorpha TaxID=2211140 RepID=A0A2Z5G5S1_9BACT|nr:hypothetical protein ACPOL_5333 [Acidisarcina polymorpha]